MLGSGPWCHGIWEVLQKVSEMWELLFWTFVVRCKEGWDVAEVEC